jgi:hypothetical protein
MPVLTFRIAAIDLVLDGKGTELPGGWGDLEPFRITPAGAAPGFLLDWRCAAGLPNPGWHGDAAFEDLADGVVAFRRADFEGRVDPAMGRGVLETAPSVGAVRSALRFVASLALLERDGFLLHSAGLVESGSAYLLFGPSGAGKSTAAGLSRPRILLSDELCALRRVGAGWRAFGTPFAGSLGEPGGSGEAPVGAVAFLEKAETVSTCPLAAGEMLPLLYPQIFRPSRASGRHTRWLALAASLAVSVPCLTLRFRRDPSFWDVLKAQGRAA